MPGKQAAAAVGQCELMYIYDKLFREYNQIVAQLLITAPDLLCESRLIHFSNTLSRLLDLGALPIINESDTVSTEEIVIGDNDTLSARVAAVIHGNLLVLLSDIDGLFDRDPHRFPDARPIPLVARLDETILALGGAPGSSLGSGGMAPSSKPPRSQRRQAAPWSLPTEAIPIYSMISQREKPLAPGFWPKRRPVYDYHRAVKENQRL